MSTARNVSVSHWIDGTPITELTIWPLGEGASRHAKLADRLTVALYTGASNVSLKPTSAEARKLIEALEWALQGDGASA